MIALIAKFEVPEENASSFETIIAELAAATRANEPQVTLYQLCRSPERPTDYRMMELYADRAALDAHLAADWFKTAGKALRSLLSAKPILETFDTVG